MSPAHGGWRSQWRRSVQPFLGPRGAQVAHLPAGARARERAHRTPRRKDRDVNLDGERGPPGPSFASFASVPLTFRLAFASDGVWDATLFALPSLQHYSAFLRILFATDSSCLVPEFTGFVVAGRRMGRGQSCRKFYGGTRVSPFNSHYRLPLPEARW